MFKSSKAVYFWIGLLLTGGGLLPVSINWYSDWGRWLFLAPGLVLMFIWAPFDVWQKTEKERERLKAEKDTEEPQVELTNFDNELEYEITENQKFIHIELGGILRNNSVQYHGSLDFFRIEVPTPRGSFIATSNYPPLGYKFEPNSIYEDKHFIFSANISKQIIKVDSWETFLKGKEGRINLLVQGQKIRSYPIKIADVEGLS